MGWSKAYNFNLGEDISISEALNLRKGNDPRAGDLWCHKSCYESKNGSQLLSRIESVNKKTGEIKKKSHFAKWPRKYDKSSSDCGIESIAKAKRESMDYAHYIIMFEEYLSQLKGEKDPYFVQDVIQYNLEYEPDFELIHDEPIQGIISKTQIHIIDENKRRKKKYSLTRIMNDEFILILKISEYTIEQLNDFEIGGISKFRVEWDYLIKTLRAKLSKQSVQKKDIDTEQGITNSQLDRYYFEISGPDLEISATMPTIAYRAEIQGIKFPHKSLRFSGSRVVNYLNKYATVENLNPQYLPISLSHLQENSVCIDCHGKLKYHSSCKCTSTWLSEKKRGEYYCSSVGMDDAFELFSKCGLEVRCPKCHNNLFDHFRILDNLLNFGMYDHKKKKEIISLITNNAVFAISDLVEIGDPRQHHNQYWKECDVWQEYSIENILVRLLKNGFDSVCEHCDHEMYNHLKVRDTLFRESIALRLSSNYPNAEALAKLLSSLDKDGNLNVKDFFSLRSPKIEYDSQCEYECVNGMQIKKCDHANEKWCHIKMNSKRLTCGGNDHFPETHTSILAFKFYKDEMINTVKLLCLHCGEETDRFELTTEIVEKHTWTLSELHGLPRLDLRKYTNVERALLKSIGTIQAGGGARININYR